MIVLHAVLLYVVTGLLFGLVFVTRGVGRMDAQAREAGWGFRAIILPGVVALWPLLLMRWRKVL